MQSSKIIELIRERLINEEIILPERMKGEHSDKLNSCNICTSNEIHELLDRVLSEFQEVEMIERIFKMS